MRFSSVLSKSSTHTEAEHLISMGKFDKCLEWASSSTVAVSELEQLTTGSPDILESLRNSMLELKE